MLGQTLEYKVLQKNKNFEIRHYAEYIIASIEIDSDFTQALNSGFSVLSDYILGHNWSRKHTPIDGRVTGQKVSGEKIGMTNPVLAAAAERQGYIISFVMPPKFSLENLPEPFDKRIYIRDITAHKTAVLKFNGNLDEIMMTEKTAEIEAWLTPNKLYHKPGFTFAQYNSPGIPARFRRNEIIANLD
jgi:hypothetical protein